ncbi:HAUS augmin-like complex subunit 6 isoform X1 [Parasteatoda tepidariorum]|uniref:HAUS augmin-like complex subunit 6 isoform X1 n=1 Tax=Parasteatoda tepidariorum TaxID=114398 RepID=UPI001C71B669|nr:uncharacterized protein LOC107446815 isoform X1 [Parasteatoda tepidariorum]XP_042911378.1 uncharacterized protein LOC107446815 isoform X1 [Parasteatoda tepidariorum]XP_042911379.1 uncharacterized protein LOC107446815 isoform X1 [Parasteatoda tepidariorum]XP_042911380.1 uncharacterized protein LOC107446815 isoform X1 [Parasteatoda tepidariorum]XP_042911381.1 uncharacterized protein LOC107446815 isoform X1 [Parasteatoda tepidariorum]
MDYIGASPRRQNIFFNSLLALGFDVTAMSKEHKIVFDKKMFLLPNRKGMEVVTHFLLSKLNKECGGKFSIIWPLMDVKDQRQFSKTTFEYLTQIAQVSEIKFPPVLNSVFSSFGGTAFFDLYLAFSTHVVQQVNKTFGPMLRRPKFDPKLTKHAIEMLKLTSIASVEKFRSLTDTTKFHLEAYFCIAKKFYDCVERLELSNSKSQSLLEEKIKAAIKIFPNLVEKSLKGLTMKNKEHQNNIDVLWRKIEAFLSKEEKMWSFISSELEDSAKPILRGGACSFNLSNNLKNCSEDRYPELRNQLSEEGNQLSIPQFLKLFTVVLEFYVDSIKKGELSETYKFQFLKHTSELDKSFKMLQSLCDLLEKDNQVNKNQLQTLKEEIMNEPNFMDDKSNFFKDLPPSPEACLKSYENTPIFLCPSVKGMKLDDNIEKVLVINSSQILNHPTPSENDSVVSPIQTGQINCLTSLNNGLNYSDLTESANEEIFNQTSLTSTTDKDTVSDVPEVDFSVSWMQEESLHSQTLSDLPSLSFLD